MYRLRDGSARAPDRRPHARRGARAPGQAHARGGRPPPAALDHHAGARPRAGRRARLLHVAGPRRRRLPDLLRRPHGHGPRAAGRRDPHAPPAPCAPPAARWSTRPTRRAAATTSPSSSSASRRSAPATSPRTTTTTSEHSAVRGRDGRGRGGRARRGRRPRRAPSGVGAAASRAPPRADAARRSAAAGCACRPAWSRAVVVLADRGPRRATSPRRPSTSSAPATTGFVTVYRGMPYDLPAGLHLYGVNYESGVPADSLTAGAEAHRQRAQAARQGRRAGPRAPARDRGAGSRMRSVRNRELLALVPASLLLTAGFAAIFIERSDVLSNVSLTYGADLPRAVLRRAHGAALHAARRRPLPVPAVRDPGLLRPGDDLPDRREARPRAGAVVRHRPDPVLGDDHRAARRLPRARALPLHDRGGRDRAAAAAARPGHRRPGQRRLPRHPPRADHGAAGRVRQDRDHRLPGQLPARHAPAAGHRRAALRRHHAAAAEALRPAAGGLGRGDADALRHPGPRLVADVLRRLPGAALRGDQPRVVRGHRAERVRLRGVGALPRPPDHHAPRRRLAAPVQPAPLRAGRGQLPDRAVRLRAGRRRASSGAASARRC